MTFSKCGTLLRFGPCHSPSPRGRTPWLRDGRRRPESYFIQDSAVRPRPSVRLRGSGCPTSLSLAARRARGRGAAARVVNLSISRNDFVNPEILHPSPPPPPPLPLPLRPPRHFTTAPSSLTTIRSAAATKVESADGRTTALLRSEAGAASLLGSITRE